MNKRLTMTFLTALLALQTVLAQSFVVKGNVISKEDNEPLIGVAIRQLENPTNGLSITHQKVEVYPLLFT